MNIIQKPIKAYSARGVHRPLVFVLHGTDGTASSAYNTFVNVANQKSSTMIATRTGELWQLVPVEQAPWTNGTTRNPTSNLIKSMPAGMNINLISLTIEMEEYPGCGGEGDITEAQFWSVVYGIKWMQSEVKRIYGYTIPMYPERIIGHYQIDSTGKPSCPGPLFNWSRMYSECAKITAMSLDDAAEYIASQQDNGSLRAYTIAMRVDDLNKKLTDPKWGASAKQKLSFLLNIVSGADTVDKVVTTVKALYTKKDYDGVLQFEKTMKDKGLI